MKFETKVLHSGQSVDPLTGAVNIPIYQTSTYRQATFGEHQGYEYSRTQNPTRAALERLVAELEEGSHGFAYASGMAAISSVFMIYHSGAHVVISDNVYGGTYRVLEKVFKHFGLTFTAVNTSDIAAVEQAITGDTVAIYIETPTNPLLGISDISALSNLAHEHHLHAIVDNTFMSPYLQQPLRLGADIVIHSATKYLGGHSDLVAGVVVVKDEDLAQQLAFVQNAVGAVLGPQDAFLLIRGIKTLALRMDRHLENTTAILAYLSVHPLVRKIYHPTRAEHINHETFMQQTAGNVAIISFVVDDTIDIREFGRRLKIIAVGESLGGVESLLTHPASMTHAAYPKEIREALGISEQLLRLSVGIEHADDLIADLDQAFKGA